MSEKPLVLIISPASAKANNGNWQTASRWARFLQAQYRVQIANAWPSESGVSNESNESKPDLMIALHARRSASSIQAWRARDARAPLVLVLTGTDLYRDIGQDETARHCMYLADRLVVLQEAGRNELREAGLPPVQVIHQSAPTQICVSKPLDASGRAPFTTIMIGHLRAEKRPDTYMQAARLMAAPPPRMLHLGSALEPALGALAQDTAAACPHYQWLGNLAHEETLRHLAQSELMVISSEMEGGANVIIEAVVAGVPVLASDIPGNRGMLGEDYAGYFPLGDAGALAAAIHRARTDPEYLLMLRRQCQARAPLFDPARERSALLTLVGELMDNG